MNFLKKTLPLQSKLSIKHFLHQRLVRLLVRHETLRGVKAFSKVAACLGSWLIVNLVILANVKSTWLKVILQAVLLKRDATEEYKLFSHCVVKS